MICVTFHKIVKNSKVITKISRTTTALKSDLWLTTFYFLGAIGSVVFPVDGGKNFLYIVTKSGGKIMLGRRIEVIQLC